MSKAIWCILMIFITACSNRSHNTTANITKKDTVFLLKERDTGQNPFYHIVYIETNRNSWYYQQLRNFEMHGYDSSGFIDTYQFLKKKHQQPLKHVNLNELSKEWVPLHLYKQHYYVYWPDWRRTITDSLLLLWNMEGPMPFIIDSLKKINANKYVLFILDPFHTQSGLPAPKELTIYILNNKMAVWKLTNQDKHVDYALMVPKESINDFNLVVNYCDHLEQEEYQFDEINYQKLIANLK